MSFRIHKAAGVAALTLFFSACSGAQHAAIVPAPPNGAHILVVQTGTGDKLVTFTLPVNTPPNTARQLARGTDGNVWFSDDGYAVGKVTVRGTFSIYPAPASCVSRLTAGKTLMYASNQTCPNAIFAITSGGTYTSFPLGTVDPEYNQLVLGHDGFVYFWAVDTATNVTALYKMSADGYSLTNFPTTVNGPRAIAMTVGPNFNLYGVQNSAIVVFNPVALSFTNFPFPAGVTNGSVNLQGIAFFNSALYFSFDKGLEKMTAAGKFSTIPLDGTQAGPVVVGKDGNLYTLTAGSGSAVNLWRIDKTGAVTNLGSDARLPSGVNQVLTMISGSDGNLWIGDDGSKIWVYVLYDLSVSPQSLSMSLSSNPSAVLTVSESLSGGTLSVASSNIAVASVTPASPGTYTVSAVGAGACVITVKDTQKNMVEVPVVVSP